MSPRQRKEDGPSEDPRTLDEVVSEYDQALQEPEFRGAVVLGRLVAIQNVALMSGLSPKKIYSKLEREAAKAVTKAGEVQDPLLDTFQGMETSFKAAKASFSEPRGTHADTPVSSMRMSEAKP